MKFDKKKYKFCANNFRVPNLQIEKIKCFFLLKLK